MDSFLIINPDIEEARQGKETPGDYVMRNAELKAQAAANQLTGSSQEDWLVIAADTIVVDGDQVLGKPADESQAIQILTSLRGKTHTVFSGLAVLDTSRGKIQTRQVSTPVSMREYTDQEIEDYVASGDPLDKAGAYAIQNEGFDPAPGFNDCYANVMGLPLCHLALVLNEMHCPGFGDVARRCQESIGYQCPVFARILSGMGMKE